MVDTTISEDERALETLLRLTFGGDRGDETNLTFTKDQVSDAAMDLLECSRAAADALTNELLTRLSASNEIGMIAVETIHDLQYVWKRKLNIVYK